MDTCTVGMRVGCQTAGILFVGTVLLLGCGGGSSGAAVDRLVGVADDGRRR
jgi:hypothetical protein